MMKQVVPVMLSLTGLNDEAGSACDVVSNWLNDDAGSDCGWLNDEEGILVSEARTKSTLVPKQQKLLFEELSQPVYGFHFAFSSHS